MRSLFVRKPLARILSEAEEDVRGLRRTLTPFSLIMIGIGAIIGAGLFIRTAAAVADNAGPAVTIAYLFAGIGCAFSGLCYAEFASKIPIAGSAYTYLYATLGEFVAWMIGWNLVLEYALGASTVAIGWSQYLNKLLEYVGLDVPYEWSHTPFHSAVEINGVMHDGIMNVPAMVIVFIISAILIRGIHASAIFNNFIVSIKLAIVLAFIIIGWQFINPANHTPFIPAPTIYVDYLGIEYNYGGIEGILGAAGIVFFAFIGFDAVSTVAQETINPPRSMPIGILGSLAICTTLYIVFSYVLTGIASVEDFRTIGREASITYAIQKYMVGYEWLAILVTIAILIGLTSVILVLLLGQSRIFYTMSKDGLLPKMFSDIHPRFGTPYKTNILFAIAISLISAFIPDDIVGNMTSIGTLFAFILVCVGILVLRRNHATLVGQFKTPFVPLVPILGIIVCGSMVYGLGYLNWIRLVGWLFIGLIVYFTYSRFHGKTY